MLSQRFVSEKGNITVWVTVEGDDSDVPPTLVLRVWNLNGGGRWFSLGALWKNRRVIAYWREIARIRCGIMLHSRKELVDLCAVVRDWLLDNGQLTA